MIDVVKSMETAGEMISQVREYGCLEGAQRSLLYQLVNFKPNEDFVDRVGNIGGNDTRNVNAGLDHLGSSVAGF